MKKIKTKEQQKKEQQKKQTILSIFLVCLLALSTAGFAFFSSPEERRQRYEYNGLTFIQQNNLWYTQINEENYVFEYLPNQLENIPINITKTSYDYLNQPLYFVNFNQQAYLITQNLQNYFLRSQEACLPNKECKENLPIKDCEQDNIIIIEESNKTKVYQEKNCIYIKGDISKATNKLLYTLLNIT